MGGRATLVLNRPTGQIKSTVLANLIVIHNHLTLLIRIIGGKKRLSFLFLMTIS